MIALFQTVLSDFRERTRRYSIRIVRRTGLLTYKTAEYTKGGRLKLVWGGNSVERESPPDEFEGATLPLTGRVILSCILSLTLFIIGVCRGLNNAQQHMAYSDDTEARELDAYADR